MSSSNVFINDFRLEAKFYSMNTFSNKEFLFASEVLESSNYNSIYGLNVKGLGYPVLRMNEFETLFTGQPIQHSENFSRQDFETHRLKKDDILICRTNGNPNLVGKSALVAKDYPFVYESHLFKVRANRELINSATLSIYLNTKYGRLEIDRLLMQGNQANFSLAKFKEIRVPKLSHLLCGIIEERVYTSFSYLEKSKQLYEKAEKLFLKEFDLLNYNPSEEKVAIKTFSTSFGNSGRLDSEYYQPKYDEIISKVKISKYDSLDNIVNINKSVEPGSKEYQNSGLPFVRVSNLTKFGLSEPDIHLAKNLFDEETLEKLQPKKDTILLSKDGTVGIAYNLKEDSNIITSGAILHFTIKDTRVLPEYLTLVLNSLVVQLQSERDAGGSIIKHWKPSEIAEVLIPIIDDKIQSQISEKIKESFKLREESKQLLEVVKKAVEVAIEENEDTAIKLIEDVK